MKMAYQPHYNIHYSYPKFHRRVLANLFDFILFVFAFFLLFLATRAAVTHVPVYVEKDETMMAIRLDSGLYRVKDGKTIDVVTYLDMEENNYTSYAKMSLSSQAIDDFIVYVGEVSGQEDQEAVQKDYDAYRLDPGLVYEGAPFFIQDDSGSILRNKACGADNQTYFSSAYAPFLDEHCQGYLITMVPGYLELTRFESNMLLFVEIPIAYLMGGILVYLVPPLFFKKGRRTLGKAMYQIGLVDNRLLSCSLPRFLGRWAIFFFGELCLSLFTFGIPVIVSFSLMAFSKHKQGFPDYLLGLYEVDISQNKLYSSYEEISLDGVEGEKKPIDFKATYED